MTKPEWQFQVCIIPLVNRAVLFLAQVFFIPGVNIPVAHLAHTLEFGKYSCQVV